MRCLEFAKYIHTFFCDKICHFQINLSNIKVANFTTFCDKKLLAKVALKLLLCINFLTNFVTFHLKFETLGNLKSYFHIDFLAVVSVV